MGKGKRWAKTEQEVEVREGKAHRQDEGERIWHLAGQLAGTEFSNARGAAWRDAQKSFRSRRERIWAD